MTETVNFLNSPQLEKFSGLVVSTFASSLTAISSRTVNLSLGEMVKCDADTLFAPYENETLISAKEDNGGFETGLLFRTRDITKLADFMLAGDGESKDEIDDDTKDAVQELTGKRYNLGPYKPPVKRVEKNDPLDEFTDNLKEKGIEITEE